MNRVLQKFSRDRFKLMTSRLLPSGVDGDNENNIVGWDGLRAAQKFKLLTAAPRVSAISSRSQSLNDYSHSTNGHAFNTDYFRDDNSPHSFLVISIACKLFNNEPIMRTGLQQLNFLANKRYHS